MFKTIFLLPVLLISFLSHAQEKEPFFQNVEASFTYSGDVFASLNGGLKTGIRYMDNIDVEVGFDAKTLSFYFYGLGNQGNSISEIVGDVQIISNIDAENSWRLYEAWMLKSVPKIKSSFLVGLYDLNSEFDVINTGGLFLNSSHGIGPDFSSSGINGPSIFPLTSIAARFKLQPLSFLSLKIVVVDAVPSDPGNINGTSVYLRKNEGALLVSELTFTNGEEHPISRLKRETNQVSPFRLVLGGWKYTKEREGWLGDLESDHGVYAIVEFAFQNGLSLFARAGATNRDINRFNYYLGSGLNYSGLLKTRQDDVLGLAFSLPINSDDFILAEERNGNNFSKNESTIELTYLWIIYEHVSFQFDTQYINNPNQAPEIDNAYVVGVRSVFSF